MRFPRELTELRGCGTALVTPFGRDGSVDESALKELVGSQIAAGIKLLVPCGTTGEAATLSESETIRVIEIACAAASGQAMVFAGCTHNATHVAVERARRISQIGGLTGLLSASPFYNRPGQEGQYQHFRAIAEGTDLPVLLYNIPSRTGANLEAATVLRLAEIANIVGIKESSGNMTQIAELLTSVPERFKVFAGDDALALPIIALGGVGLISVASNAIPAEMMALVDAALRGEWTAARQMNRRLFRLMMAHFAEPSPAPIKAVMAMLGTGTESMRLPMVPVREGTRAMLRSLVEEIGLLP